MRVFANNIIENNGIQRIVDAIKKYAPKDIEFVDRERDAEFVIIYAYGQRRKVEKRIKWIMERGQKYAMVQIAVRSTANPDTRDWLPMWQSAELVWSYYNLRELCHEDGRELIFNFYYAPLGVESELFKDYDMERHIEIIVGDSRDESVNEIIRAAQGNVAHLGIGVSDKRLAETYSQCRYVSGLRRKEGFELPVLEGLLCGARPICYDKPHYRHWFNGLAEFIPEGSPEEVTRSLEKIFEQPNEPITEIEKEWVRNRFNWQPIVEKFWEKIK